MPSCNNFHPWAIGSRATCLATYWPCRSESSRRDHAARRCSWLIAAAACTALKVPHNTLHEYKVKSRGKGSVSHYHDRYQPATRYCCQRSTSAAPTCMRRQLLPTNEVQPAALKQALVHVMRITMPQLWLQTLSLSLSLSLSPSLPLSLHLGSIYSPLLRSRHTNLDGKQNNIKQTCAIDREDTEAKVAHVLDAKPGRNSQYPKDILRVKEPGSVIRTHVWQSH